MIIGTFLFYFILFLFVFSSPEKLKQRDKRWTKILVLPAVFALILAFLTVIKVFFIYKIILIIVLGLTTLLTYWQYGERIKHWLG
ncbi:hypothetical protein DesLBE_0374 [Desulfitobacterium sp. LBE]|uniref:Uncharacterized protein n=3 Tax=root TaxID=1 RepID=A0A098B0L8_DESHA|nr:hypothetical protein Dhaf_2976 [Desulfitobacterium hafniense DCB-2]KTE91269.1 hypothetical protein AT727_06655 [Desulfitobacterium hafniense]TWH56181.1 hypothetical protein DesLBE_0374 [Desulfitobacterium sp. LBE]CDX01885.1 Hypothetical protein DPCES_1998 [Desulfitobacterium hafniense]